MREILFRGKNKLTGKWCEGFLVKTGNHFRISTQNDLISFGVDPDTVGQYTGLIDANGKKVFEGDILPLYEDGNEYPYKVIYNGDCFMLAMLDSSQGSYPLSVKINHSKVIGNIYDNTPDPLQQSKKPEEE